MEPFLELRRGCRAQRQPARRKLRAYPTGRCRSIAVAADRCNYVRTANWQPHKYVKLGDYYSRVLQRYGWPDETPTYTASGVGGGAAAPSVSFSGTNMTFSRDCVMRYTEGGNYSARLPRRADTHLELSAHPQTLQVSAASLRRGRLFFPFG